MLDGDDLLLLQHPDPKDAAAASEDHFPELLVDYADVEGGGGSVRIDTQDGKDPVDIAKQKRGCASELVPCRANNDDAVRH
jgi:hypothetical protein